MKSSGGTSGAPGDEAVYDWERFWVGRTAMLDLSDGGFLVDPANALPIVHPGRPLELAELRKYRALGLLGEPGIGKSTVLEIEAARTTHQSDENVTSVHVDLRAYSSEGLLYQRVFGSEEFVAWTKGSAQLNPVYFENLSFSSLWSRWCLTPRLFNAAGWAEVSPRCNTGWAQ
jgi:hypothetical protein